MNINISRYSICISAGVALSFWLLFGAASPHHHAYYLGMRWVVTGTATMIAYRVITFYRGNASWCAFAAIAVIFNPIILVEMSRNDWMQVDLICAFLLVAGGITCVVSERQELVRTLQSTVLLGFWAKGTVSQYEYCDDNGVSYTPAVPKGEGLYEFYGSLDAVQTAISSGAYVDCKDSDGNTPLIFASLTGPVELVQLLLDNGADVNLAQKFGYTALTQAGYGPPEIVELLLKAGAKTNVVGGNGQTPLQGAIIGNRVEIVRLLLAAGASPNEEYENDYTALKNAISHGSYKPGGGLEMVKMLVKAGAFEHHDGEFERYGELATAVRGGHLPIVRFLLDAKFKVTSNVLSTAIHSWESDCESPGRHCGHDHADIVKLLIEAAALSSDGIPPYNLDKIVGLAQANNRQDIIDLVVAHSANKTVS